MAEERFDGMFMSVAQQAQGIEPLMDHLFSFLRRKTDFFTGASREQVEELVLKAVGKHADINEKEATKKKAAREAADKKKKALAEKKRLAEEKKKAEEAAAARAAGRAKRGRNGGGEENEDEFSE